jgi:hypothetical protein
MKRTKAKHRASRRKINWQGMKRTLQNRWWFFWKPAIKQNIKTFLGKR